MDTTDIAIIGAGNIGIAVACYLVARHKVSQIVLIEPGNLMALTSAQPGEILGDPAVCERLSGMGADPAPSTPEAFRELIAADIEKWAPVVRATSLQP